MRGPETYIEALAEIERLQKENEAVSDALHKMSNECSIMLSNKDRAMVDKCRNCKRGRPFNG